MGINQSKELKNISMEKHPNISPVFHTKDHKSWKNLKSIVFKEDCE